MLSQSLTLWISTKLATVTIAPVGIVAYVFMLLLEYLSQNSCTYAVSSKLNSNIFVYRYIMIPANRGKENKEQGMALRGTGGSGELINLEKLYHIL